MGELHVVPNADDKDQVTVLAELVGGYHLQLESHVQGIKEKHLRPFCVVKFENRTIHYSGPCDEKGTDPIWTVSTGSLFIVKVSPRTLIHDNLQINIWSRKNSSSLRETVLCDTDNYFLGRVNIDGQTLLSNCSEQRLELPLEDRNGNEIHKDCTIALRFRLASDSDIRLLDVLRDQGFPPPDFHASFSRADSKLGLSNPVKDLILGEDVSRLPIADVVTEANETKVAGDFLVDTITSAFTSSTKCDRETGLRKVRVKPSPDPARVEQTRYMSPLEISRETNDPSQRWVEAGSGHVGTLHLEILSCHDLPNVDVGEAVGNLTDCFVTAVFEDVMLQTPVIDDELSPHWLPWTQRAFRVGIVHPSSILYLAAFDYDFASEHEAIGRVAINLTNFQSNTMYTLTYKLHPTSALQERTPNGTITIRLRVEYTNEKAAILAALQPAPTFHVNTQNSKTFKVLRYTCFGEYDIEEKFSWAVTRSYIFEVLEYWRGLKFYIGECIRSLVFWRGQVQICSMNLPVHSAVLFCSGAIMVERPWLVVPFTFFFLAWFLLATMAQRRKTPSPWHTCTSFLSFAEILLTGKSSHNVDTIRPTQYVKQTEEYENSIKAWREQYQSSVNKAAELEEKLMEIGNENISTEVSGQMVPLDLLEKLGRYQGMLGRVCTKLRRFKSLIIWEDSMTSFWITAKCLVLGIATLLLPWRYLLYLVGRIVVWGFLGPHMKLVDIYFEAKKSQREDREVEEYRKQTRLARIRREEAMKLKDLKCLAFGEYVATVPSENLPCHYDRPLHESSARYLSHSTAPKKVPATSRIPGQQLYGAMIPHTKSSWASHQEEMRRRETRLAALEEQVKRLQTIEEHVSSRALGADLDEDLPEDLGYEVTLGGGLLHLGEGNYDQEEEEESQGNCTRNDSHCSDLVGPSSSQIAGDCITEDDDELSTQSDKIHSAAKEGAEVDDGDSHVTPTRNQIKSHSNVKRQSVIEPGFEIEPVESFMTPLTLQSCSIEEASKFNEKFSPQSQATTPEETHSDYAALMTPTDEKAVEVASKGQQEAYFMTPEYCEEEKKEQENDASDLLELHLRDRDESSLKEIESSIPSGRHQLKGPRQKAMVLAKSIGSGSMPSDDCTKAEKRDASIQVMCIGSGSLRSVNEGELTLGQCMLGTQKKKLVVDTGTANEAGTDVAELPTPLTTHTSTKTSSHEEGAKSTPCQSITNKSAPAQQQCGTEEWPGETATSTSKCDLQEILSSNTTCSILASETDITEATNNTSQVTKRLPSFAQSLNMQDTGDIRRTWSSGSLQRETTWIKQNPTDSVLEIPQRNRGSIVGEEGLEVVAMGRLRTIGDALSEGDDYSSGFGDDTGAASDDHDVPDSPRRGLSVPYKTNSFVQVAHYRP